MKTRKGRDPLRRWVGRWFVRFAAAGSRDPWLRRVSWAISDPCLWRGPTIQDPICHEGATSPVSRWSSRRRRKFCRIWVGMGVWGIVCEL